MSDDKPTDAEEIFSEYQKEKMENEKPADTPVEPDYQHQNLLQNQHQNLLQNQHQNLLQNQHQNLLQNQHQNLQKLKNLK
jgi:hypothetical protein